jgi:hypothetical protein
MFLKDNEEMQQSPIRELEEEQRQIVYMRKIKGIKTYSVNPPKPKESQPGLIRPKTESSEIGPILINPNPSVLQRPPHTEHRRR